MFNRSKLIILFIILVVVQYASIVFGADVVALESQAWYMKIISFFLGNEPTIFAIGSALVAVAAGICAATNTPVPNYINDSTITKILKALYTVMEFVALNFGKAKQGGDK